MLINDKMTDSIYTVCQQSTSSVRTCSILPTRHKPFQNSHKKLKISRYALNSFQNMPDYFLTFVMESCDSLWRRFWACSDGEELMLVLVAEDPQRFCRCNVCNGDLFSGVMMCIKSFDRLWVDIYLVERFELIFQVSFWYLKWTYCDRSGPLHHTDHECWL